MADASTSGTAVPLRPIPGPKGLAKWRTIGQLARRPHEFYLELATTYGDIVLLDFPLETAVLLAHPDYIEHVLHHNYRNYVKQTGRWRTMRQIWGNGLVMSDGDFWRRQRQRIQPAFHAERVDAHLALFVEEATATLVSWEAAARAGETRDVYRDMRACSLRALTKAMFGSDVAGKTESITTALDAIHAYVNPVSLMSLLDPPKWVRRLLTPGYSKFEAAVQSLNDTFDGILRRRRAGDQTAADLLGLFMVATDEEVAEVMNHKELHDEMMVILMAGHETAAVAAAWAFYFISRTPDVERRLHQEIDAVLGNRLPTLDDIKKLTYTRMVIEETLRRCPPIYAFDRKAENDDVVDGYKIPRGATVGISSYAMHHHPKYWDRPEAFDPDRFDAVRSAARPDYAFFPFGGGPRRCIGFRFAMLQVTALLATLCRRVRCEYLPDHPVTPKLRLNFTPSPGIVMRVHVRQPA
jgi:cytochrome P450